MIFYLFNAIFFEVLRGVRNRNPNWKTIVGVPQKEIQLTPPPVFFNLKEHLLKGDFWNFKKNLIMGTFLSTPKVGFYNKLINLKFQKMMTPLLKNFLMGLFSFWLLKQSQKRSICWTKVFLHTLNCSKTFKKMNFSIWISVFYSLKSCKKKHWKK